MKTLNSFEKGVLAGMLMNLRKELSLPVKVVQMLSDQEQYEYQFEINVIDKALEELIPAGEDNE